MSYRRSMEQLRPARTQKIDLQEKSQILLQEATGPSGAQWENIITYYYNGAKKSDPNYKEIKDFIKDYGKQGQAIARTFKSKLKGGKMTQFGKGRGTVSNLYTKRGASNPTPKTDMYTPKYNISLKKAGGSQLASAAKGEALGMFFAALENLGKTDTKQIEKIANEIDSNFHKLVTRKNKGEIEKYATGEKSKKDLTPSDKKAVKEFIVTEEFHKELNERIKKVLNFEKNPDFMKFFVYEAMSGHAKFSGSIASASVCMEFNADTGAITKFIPCTSNGTNKFTPIPKISKELETMAKKVKIYSAWKSSKGNPYSSLRISSTLHDKQETPTLKSIIQDEIKKDRIMSSVLSEDNEIYNLHEFDPIGAITKTYDKVKSMTGSAINWLKNLVSKIMNAVRSVLNKIKELGAKMFEALFNFIGIEVERVDMSVSSDIKGFIFGTHE